jgi:hypothetical protein
MHLDDYIARHGHGTKARLSRQTGLDYTTIFKAAQRRPVRRYDTARRISEATDGEVSIAELCEPSPRQTGGQL